jgi:hypothetical protein
VLASSLSKDIDYPGWCFPLFSLVTPGKFWDSTFIRFGPLPSRLFQFMNRPTSRHALPADTDSRVKPTAHRTSGPSTSQWWLFTETRSGIRNCRLTLRGSHIPQQIYWEHNCSVVILIFGNDDNNETLIQEEIKRRLNSGNACYHSVQNLLSSRLLSKNIKVRIYKTIILLVVLYGCETWSLTLREEQGVEENIWTKEGWSDRRSEKSA